MGVHSFDKLGAKMGVHSFFWQRVRAVRHTKNMGAINGLLIQIYYTQDRFIRKKLQIEISPKVLVKKF